MITRPLLRTVSGQVSGTGPAGPSYCRRRRCRDAAGSPWIEVGGLRGASRERRCSGALGNPQADGETCGANLQLRCADSQLDSHYSSCHSSAHDYHPDPRDRFACWNCRPKPMGVAATYRDRSLHSVSHRGDGRWSGRYSNPLPRDSVHARDDWGPRLAITECLTHVVRAGSLAEAAAHATNSHTSCGRSPITRVRCG
jgi:hypothetical protein